MEIVFGIFGIIGGLLSACADMLVDLKGKDNEKVGKYGIMDSCWGRMNISRFKYSIFLEMFATPMMLLGLISLAMQMSSVNRTFGLVFFIVSITGAIGGYFIHTMCCLLPVVYKKMMPENSFEKAEEVINGIFDAIKVPFFTLYTIFVIVTSIMAGIAMFTGVLPISPWFLLLTPMVLFIFSEILRKLVPSVFYDIPGIMAASLGFAMYGIMAVYCAI